MRTAIGSVIRECKTSSFVLYGDVYSFAYLGDPMVVRKVLPKKRGVKLYSGRVVKSWILVR